MFLIVLGALKIVLCWYMCICWNIQVLLCNVVTNLTLRKIGIYVHHCIIVYFDDLHSIRLVIIIIYLFIFIFIYQEFANDLHNRNMLFKYIGPFETKKKWRTYFSLKDIYIYMLRYLHTHFEMKIWLKVLNKQRFGSWKGITEFFFLKDS